MNERRKARRWAICFGMALTLFTLFVLLDTFVIVRKYRVVGESVIVPESEALAAESAEAKAAEESAVAPESEARAAESAEVKAAAEPIITVTTYRYGDSDVHVADILLSDPSQLKTALAQNAYGRNVTERTSEMAAEHSALLAVNGDYYGSRSTGYVIRNGVLYRERSAGSDQEDLVIDSDGVFTIIREGDYTARQLLNLGAEQVFSFGPALVQAGEIAVSARDEVGQAMVSNPRTAIAMIEPLHYLFVVSDGRTDDSEGLSLYELARFMKELGASVAYNLDGGGSSTMVYEGEIVNFPTTRGSFSEREVSDIVYIQ